MKKILDMTWVIEDTLKKAKKKMKLNLKKAMDPLEEQNI